MTLKDQLQIVSASDAEAAFVPPTEAPKAKAPETGPTLDEAMARNLVSLFNPVLYPGVGEVLRITQQELAYLVGLSRQRVNEALNGLSAQGLIRVEYGGLRVLDLPGLRVSAMSNKKNASAETETS